jgi:hypothetical protein
MRTSCLFEQALAASRTSIERQRKKQRRDHGHQQPVLGANDELEGQTRADSEGQKAAGTVGLDSTERERERRCVNVVGLLSTPTRPQKEARPRFPAKVTIIGRFYSIHCLYFYLSSH